MKQALLRNSSQYVTLYFQIHQPCRLKKFRFFDIGSNMSYFDDDLDRTIMERVARLCYLPANRMLLSLIQQQPGMRVTFSISGTTLRQLEEYTPEVLYSFRALAETGCVEFLSETSYHSLACLLPGNEFETQILDHAQMLEQYLGVRANVFRNTELIYNNDVGTRIQNMGFNGIYCDGAEQILAYRSPHRLYAHPEHKHLKVFLRNYRLSDDIAFRFKVGSEHLTVEKYMNWLQGVPTDDKVINLAMDYETFGEHQKKETGIFKFMKGLLKTLATSTRFKLATPSEVLLKLKTADILPVHKYVSWADRERDLSAWLGNAMQQDAFDTLADLQDKVKEIDDPDILNTWRRLQTSDHFYYMSTKKEADGNVHAYFSPYASPYEAFINYMNIISDFSQKVGQEHKLRRAQKIRKTNEVLLEHAV